MMNGARLAQPQHVSNTSRVGKLVNHSNFVAAAAEDSRAPDFRLHPLHHPGYHRRIYFA
jgi:hypothetical protein